MFDFDLAVVGSGFGGSVLAMIARRLGLRVMLLERGSHPRFAIGESASPLAGILIEQLADRYDLPRLRPLSAHGTWRRAYPQVVCGLKRGFTYFKHEGGSRYRPRPDRSNQLLVAASPNDELSDTHWLRSDVDHFLVREAIALGAECIERVDLEHIDWKPDGNPMLIGHQNGRPVRVSARLVVDASGPRGFLSRTVPVEDFGFAGYPPTQALFSHFTGVARCDQMPEFGCEGARERGREAPPYPADDAALHHVFDGGWMWVLRFGNGVTSAGVAVIDAVARDVRLADGAPAWTRLLARYPSIAAQFADAQPIRPFTWMPRLAYRASEAAGPGWAMLPSAAAFVDPLFSSGMPLTLLGIERLVRLLGGRPEGPPWQAYSDVTLSEADHTACFVAGCYAAFPRFPAFTTYSMFYFAAASFSEMARRLGVQPSSARFLCADRPAFGSATMTLSPARPQAGDQDTYDREVAAAVEALNIAGVCDPVKRNWYGVDLEDAVRGARKLGVAPDRIRSMLAL
jgi:tetracycline 7-halogenase / FADH2 O2-dependent halogenase